MSNREHFDYWSEEYDDIVDIFQDKGFPFEGYYTVLDYVQKLVLVKDPTKIIVLELGVGTGLLSKKLYQKGIKMYGIDFSPKMLNQAKRKMPEGQFFLHDFSQGFSKKLAGIKFDFIISSYAFHHLPDIEKFKLITEAVNNLELDGQIIIADIGFETKEDLINYRKEWEEEWDEEEYYLIGEEVIQSLKQRGFTSTYKQISPCAGVLTIKKQRKIQ